MKNLIRSLILIVGASAGLSAFALPALQLGPGGAGWTYDTTTDTWMFTGDTLSLSAYANDCMSPGSMQCAWATADALAQNHRYAYLVMTAVPKTALADGDQVDLVSSTGGLSMVASGYGAPPLNDPNSLAPHGIFDSYFEIYEFKFSGNTQAIGNTQPGGGDPSGDTGTGWKKTFDLVFNIAPGAGVHFDLFTIDNGGDGKWTSGLASDKDLVEAFAPFSHDAETRVPEPSSLAMLLLGLGLIGFSMRRRAALVA